MTHYLLAGGGTAGHVNPLLALAEHIRRVEPDSKIFTLGTIEGLEARLVPERGFELRTIARLPFPRKLNGYALRFPRMFAKAVRQVENLIRDERIDVVVGFGGYASAPAYEAARKTRTPLVVHEANALPGMANRRAAKYASASGVAFVNTPMHRAKFVGMPLRPEIEALAATRDIKAARLHFGLNPDVVTLLVTGGSLGAKRLNDTIDASRKALSAAGVQVLHISGPRSDLPEVSQPGYVRISYCDRMDLAIAAADVAVARSGASTVSEFSALGLAAVYVPYPVGNGEQALNAKTVVDAGGAAMVVDSGFTPDFVSDTIIPLVSSTKRVRDMASAAKSVGVVDGTRRLFELVQSVLNPSHS
jgi:UDP-N-acetylglucosamine--N-acetylmuramyl-(pentapeptide) pyrophosphoryl-undecaprenol N-acetylglucosamine transferase